MALSRHGYGHATRAASIAAQVQRIDPSVRLIFAGPAPRQLLAAYVEGPFEQRDVVLDAGVVQPDSLTIDIGATLALARQMRGQADETLASEAEFVRREGVRLILADIPPLAAIIAHRAGIPCWMVSNFGWDDIYRPWGVEFADLVAWIEECYAKCDRLFRLPFHEPMNRFPRITDAGLTGGRPRWPADELRRRLGVQHPRQRTILITFGGFGQHRIPYAALERYRDWLFVVFDPAAPDGEHVIPIRDMSLRPVDLMPIVGRLVAKPGFSTFSEAIREGVPIVTMPRPNFAEAEVLVAGMRAVWWHQLVSLEDFLSGDWSFLEHDPAPPLSDDSVDTHGTEAIGRWVAEALAEGCVALRRSGPHCKSVYFVARPRARSTG